MNERTKQGLDVLNAALLLGVLGDSLLRATPWGLNVLLWTAALVATGVVLLARWRPAWLRGDGRRLIAPLIFFAAAFAWRDSPTLKTLNALAVLAALGLAALFSRTGRLRVAGVVEYALGIMLAFFNSLFEAFPLVFKDVRWKEIPHAGWSRHAAAIARGLLIAVPLLFVFGALFMAADVVFEEIINSSLRPDFGQIFGHVFLTIFLAWVVGGFLRGMLSGRGVVAPGGGRLPFFSSGAVNSVSLDQPIDASYTLQSDRSAVTASADDAATKSDESGSPARASKIFSLGATEAGIVLGLLDLLFLGFVVVQLRYFFGGAALVQATTGLTYAEYARRGFFELVTVAALVLPLLLVIHWLLRKENPTHERVFRILAGAQVVLLFVIMASAVGRMRLYQSEYGLTELRLYTTAFMVWLALVFVWFALSVLRGRRERFACGALAAAFLTVAALNALNPDALIVRANAAHARAAEGRSFDIGYAASLSADAVPALVEALPQMSPSERCDVAAILYRRWSSPPAALQHTDWRTWNWSRARASSVLKENADTLLPSLCAESAIRCGWLVRCR